MLTSIFRIFLSMISAVVLSLVLFTGAVFAEEVIQLDSGGFSDLVLILDGIVLTNETQESSYFETIPTNDLELKQSVAVVLVSYVNSPDVAIVAFDIAGYSRGNLYRDV